MGDTLLQALWLTVIGMGMTFAAIGALVLGMYALTALLGEKDIVEEAPEPAAAVEARPEAEPMADARYLAAAVAVSVAVAQAAQTHATSQGSAAAPADQWRAYVRSQQLQARHAYTERGLASGR